MSPSSTPGSATASKPEQAHDKWPQIVLQALAKASLSTIGDALNKDDSGASRVRSGETKVTLQEALALLDALGFKAVPAGSICVNRERYAAIAELAQAAMADPVISRRLLWEA